MKTTEQFISDARLIHGDRFNYSITEYTGAKNKIKIICKGHGMFEQTPNSHLNGSGCPVCGGSVKKTTENFIIKARQIHGDIYDYSLTEYIDAHTKVKIICKEHGVFEQTPNWHTRSNKATGCPVCSKKKKHTKESFIIDANRVHGEKYDYSLVVYKNNKTHVDIICPVHGVYTQRPDKHLQGQGCVKCLDRNISRQEVDLLNFVRSIYGSEIITNSRNVISPYELDIYLPKAKIAIEYNGEYWHKEGVMVPVGYHQMKTGLCHSKGIELIHVWERDWIGNRPHIEGLLMGALG